MIVKELINVLNELEQEKEVQFEYDGGSCQITGIVETIQDEEGSYYVLE